MFVNRDVLRCLLGCVILISWLEFLGCFLLALVLLVVFICYLWYSNNDWCRMFDLVACGLSVVFWVLVLVLLAVWLT